MWGATGKLLRVLTEEERKYWEKWSKVRQKCYNVVCTHIFFFASVLMPMTYLAACILLYPLCRHFKLKNYWLLVSGLLFWIWILYAFLFVRLWDKLKVEHKRTKIYSLKLFQYLKYKAFLEQRAELQNEVFLIVEGFSERSEGFSNLKKKLAEWLFVIRYLASIFMLWFNKLEILVPCEHL